MLTQDRLQELLSYDPETGEFYWLKPRGSRTDLVGKQAGLVNKGHGYREITIDGKSYLAHRLAWLYVHGRFPADQTDHRNRKRDDNRLDNLREATGPQNQRNMKGRVGLKGAQWNKRDKRWTGQIHLDGKLKHLGNFHTEQEAHDAYCKAAIERDKEFYCFEGGDDAAPSQSTKAG